MAVHTIKKGLDLPLLGEPQQVVADGRKVTRVAVVADDYVGMRPKLMVRVGDVVRRGQPLFGDRKCEGVLHTAPGAGKVVAINRGDQRALQSIVIELSSAEVEGNPAPDEYQPFESFKSKAIAQLSRDEIVALLAESGLWTALRRRPFGTVPSPRDDAPSAVFVTATDSNPHAPNLDKALEGREADFAAGLAVVAKLSDKTFLCKAAGSRLNGAVPGVSSEEFAGPHPSGSVGYHIHALLPVHRGRVVWHVGAQDVAAIGSLFTSGKLDVRRVVALGGPVVSKPRLLRTRLGASLEELCAGELGAGEVRVISGSVLSGRKSAGSIFGFLGRYHQQIAVLREGREREFMGWLTPGANRYSVSNAFVSALRRGSQKFAMTTNTNGSPRSMVPIGLYEKVFPFDMQPTHLLRAILSKDLEKAEELGMLELEPEDLDLCTFVCPGKSEYLAMLRENLETVRKEG
jgi:Na+-transporting NADH:ubiquinone oxidoreductase subunit A